MKSNALARMGALVLSTVFATVATVGVAVMMATHSEQADTGFAANAAARQITQPAVPVFTHWQAPAATSGQTL